MSENHPKSKPHNHKTCVHVLARERERVRRLGEKWSSLAEVGEGDFLSIIERNVFYGWHPNFLRVHQMREISANSP